jgi:hypothetical protein
MGCSRLDPDTFGAEKPVLACKGCVQPVDSNLVKRVARQHGLFSGSLLLLFPAKWMGVAILLRTDWSGFDQQRSGKGAAGNCNLGDLCSWVSLEGPEIAAQF